MQSIMSIGNALGAFWYILVVVLLGCRARVLCTFVQTGQGPGGLGSGRFQVCCPLCNHRSMVPVVNAPHAIPGCISCFNYKTAATFFGEG